MKIAERMALLVASALLVLPFAALARSQVLPETGPLPPLPNWGDHDDAHAWHDAPRWWEHRADWARAYHPEWWGDFDDHQVWRPDTWWQQTAPTGMGRRLRGPSRLARSELVAAQ